MISDSRNRTSSHPVAVNSLLVSVSVSPCPSCLVDSVGLEGPFFEIVVVGTRIAAVVVVVVVGTLDDNVVVAGTVGAGQREVLG